jgi:glutamate-1-semialdehyde 2,1-aminomutase
MEKSRQLFQKAERVIPGGVNSPVRACRGVGCEPMFIQSAKGTRISTVDGEELVDFVMSWGPMILGYAHPEVQEAVQAAVARGSSFGAPCEDEVLMAEAVREALPGVEMLRMVNSGTEATMSALRLARAHTGRSGVLKFEGCYHGHADSFLASAGSGVATLSIPGTPGVPPETVRHTLLAPYNDLEAVKKLFSEKGSEIAAVIVEPVAGNMGCVPPVPGFLQGLREQCDEHGALLIFDEVITGFRVSYGGAQAAYGVTPDLTCFGKIVGGGFPVGAFGGKEEIMGRMAPVGDVYQAGTLSGNPVAMAAGLATLKLLANSDYDALGSRTADLVGELKAVFAKKGLPVTINHVASIFTVFFNEGPVTDFSSAKKSDGETYARLYSSLREAGINLAPSGFECAFTSFAHSDEDLERLVAAVKEADLS